MVIFCAILPVPPQADPAPRPDGEDVAKGVLEPREGVDGRAPRISSGLEGLRYIPRARPPGLILPGGYRARAEFLGGICRPKYLLT